MAEEAKPVETTTPEAAETAAEPQRSEPPAVDTVSISKAELDKIQRALKEANAEAARHRKALQAVEQAEQAKKDESLSEMDKLAKKLATIEQEKQEYAAKLAARELLDRKTAIARKHGLPESLAARLIGESDEDLEADAKALLDTLPKPTPAKPPQPGPVSPTNPSAAGTGMTLAQQRERIYGPNSNPWDPAANEKHGGGVYFNQRNNNNGGG